MQLKNLRGKLFAYLLPGALGIRGAPGAVGAPGAPGVPGAPTFGIGRVLTGSSAPHWGHIVSVGWQVALHEGQVLSVDTAAGLKHMEISFRKTVDEINRKSGSAYCIVATVKIAVPRPVVCSWKKALIPMV